MSENRRPSFSRHKSSPLFSCCKATRPHFNHIQDLPERQPNNQSDHINFYGLESFLQKIHESKVNLPKNEQIEIPKELNFLNEKFFIPKRHLFIKEKNSSVIHSSSRNTIFKGKIINSDGTHINVACKVSNNVITTIPAAFKDFSGFCNLVKVYDKAGQHENLAGLVGVYCPQQEQTKSGLSASSDKSKSSTSIRSLSTSLSPFHPIFNKFILITHYMDFRDLKNYLKFSQNKIKIGVIMNYIYHAGKGLGYLHEKNIIHGEVCAENLLISSSGVLKVANFGRKMASQNQDQDDLSKSKFLRWLPPELFRVKTGEMSLHFNFNSDIWSFAITIWELFTKCKILPYKNIKTENFKFSIESAHQRLSKPKDCPLSLYFLMIRCWHIDENSRPNFNQINRSIKHFITRPEGFKIDEDKVLEGKVDKFDTKLEFQEQVIYKEQVSSYVAEFMRPESALFFEGADYLEMEVNPQTGWRIIKVYEVVDEVNDHDQADNQSDQNGNEWKSRHKRKTILSTDDIQVDLVNLTSTRSAMF